LAQEQQVVHTRDQRSEDHRAEAGDDADDEREHAQDDQQQRTRILGHRRRAGLGLVKLR